MEKYSMKAYLCRQAINQLWATVCFKKNPLQGTLHCKQPSPPRQVPQPRAGSKKGNKTLKRHSWSTISLRINKAKESISEQGVVGGKGSNIKYKHLLGRPSRYFISSRRKVLTGCYLANQNQPPCKQPNSAWPGSRTQTSVPKALCCTG